MEIWKAIPDWPGYYASSEGRIKGPLKILKPYQRPDGYLHVQLCKSGQPDTRFLLHRLICIVFHGPPPFEGAQAMHKNHIRNDCRESNVRWGTRAENMHEAVLAGRTAKNKTNVKLTAEQVIEIRQRVAAGEMQKTVAKEFGLNPCTVSNIVRRSIWKDI